MLDVNWARTVFPPGALDDPTSVGLTSAHTVTLADENSPFRLDTGEFIAPVDVEYETYGTLSAARDNVVLV
ncbi:MAG TPA: hypothetical protein PLJ50_03845, partial [Candidatus Latescibacteria bacterium]|nr:hypothetical protein [Candidatus Latescibacterota bacterium]